MIDHLNLTNAIAIQSHHYDVKGKQRIETVKLPNIYKDKSVTQR